MSFPFVHCSFICQFKRIPRSADFCLTCMTCTPSGGMVQNSAELSCTTHVLIVLNILPCFRCCPAWALVGTKQCCAKRCPLCVDSSKLRLLWLQSISMLHVKTGFPEIRNSSTLFTRIRNLGEALQVFRIPVKSLREFPDTSGDPKSRIYVTDLRTPASKPNTLADMPLHAGPLADLTSHMILCNTEIS